MCQGATPLAGLAHKWAVTRVCPTSACRSGLLAFGAHRDRIFNHVLRQLGVMLVHHMLSPVRLRKPHCLLQEAGGHTSTLEMAG